MALAFWAGLASAFGKSFESAAREKQLHEYRKELIDYQMRAQSKLMDKQQKFQTDLTMLKHHLSSLSMLEKQRLDLEKMEASHKFQMEAINHQGWTNAGLMRLQSALRQQEQLQNKAYDFLGRWLSAEHEAKLKEGLMKEQAKMQISLGKSVPQNLLRLYAKGKEVMTQYLKAKAKKPDLTIEQFLGEPLDEGILSPTRGDLFGKDVMDAIGVYKSLGSGGFPLFMANPTGTAPKSTSTNLPSPTQGSSSFNRYPGVITPDISSPLFSNTIKSLIEAIRRSKKGAKK